MPTINTYPSSAPEVSPSSFPFSPDSYSLPKSITSPSNPQSPLLPTNSPTFLVSSSDCKRVFKVPTSPAHKETQDGINSYVEWMEGENEIHQDENDGVIIFPTYHDSAFPESIATCEPQCRGDLELLAAEFEDELYYSSEETACEEETDSNPSSWSSSPSLEGEEFDHCGQNLCESWSNASCSTPPPTTPPFIFAEDDISLNCFSQSAHCVDYLAHAWKTDDLWTSYKHVHSHRESIRASKRLENALWRVWWRDHNGLGRLDPESIHWLKDSDVTWLYGPFQPSTSPAPSNISSPVSSQNISPTKSLLKKRNPAQVLQQRSEYTFSLLREATGFVLPPPPPSPIPESQYKYLRRDMESLGLKSKEKRKRVVFNETVILYREVVGESSDSDNDSEDFFEGFDDAFDEVD